MKMIEKTKMVTSDTFQHHKIKPFLEKVFVQFKKELEDIQEILYQGDCRNNVFEQNETAWVGIFNNAIVKAFPSEAATLQEYSVFDCENKSVGRADLLVCWEETYLLFEAKTYREIKSENLCDDPKEEFDSTLRQAKKYVSAESEYYKGKSVYIIPIFFGKIKKKLILNGAKKCLELNKQRGETDFCSLFFDDSMEEGVWVYGKIFDTKQI